MLIRKHPEMKNNKLTQEAFFKNKSFKWVYEYELSDFALLLGSFSAIKTTIWTSSSAKTRIMKFINIESFSNNAIPDNNFLYLIACSHQLTSLSKIGPGQEMVKIWFMMPIRDEFQSFKHEVTTFYRMCRLTSPPGSSPPNLL